MNGYSTVFHEEKNRGAPAILSLRSFSCLSVGNGRLYKFSVNSINGVSVSMGINISFNSTSVKSLPATVHMMTYSIGKEAFEPNSSFADKVKWMIHIESPLYMVSSLEIPLKLIPSPLKVFSKYGLILSFALDSRDGAGFEQATKISADKTTISIFILFMTAKVGKRFQRTSKKQQYLI